MQSESSESDSSSHDSNCDFDSDSSCEIPSKPKKKTLQSGSYTKTSNTVNFHKYVRIQIYNLSWFPILYHSCSLQGNLRLF